MDEHPEERGDLRDLLRSDSISTSIITHPYITSALVEPLSPYCKYSLVSILSNVEAYMSNSVVVGRWFLCCISL